MTQHLRAFALTFLLLSPLAGAQSVSAQPGTGVLSFCGDSSCDELTDGDGVGIGNDCDPDADDDGTPDGADDCIAFQDACLTCGGTRSDTASGYCCRATSPNAPIAGFAWAALSLQTENTTRRRRAY